MKIKPGGMGLKAIRENDIAVRLPKTYAYLKHFEAPLRKRSGYRRYFKPTDPFYSTFNIGDYTFMTYRVAWAREDRALRAAVIGDIFSESTNLQKRIMPDQTLQFVPCETEQEAHYVCSLLNNSISNYIAKSYTTDITTRIINTIPIRVFDSTDALHQRLAHLSQEAHTATAANDTTRVAAIEAEIDQLAARLWGLTEAELRDIQESLAELG